MAELLRSISVRLRELINDRRRAPRYRVRLPLSVTLIDAPPVIPGGRRKLSLDGYTRDVSATGLAIIVPAIRIGDRYLTGEDRQLRISLELPTGPVELVALPVRHEQLDAEEANDVGFLIGVQIAEMSREDRERFERFIALLRRNR